jgi:hypothetical protein
MSSRSSLASNLQLVVSATLFGGKGGNGGVGVGGGDSSSSSSSSHPLAFSISWPAGKTYINITDMPVVR